MKRLAINIFRIPVDGGEWLFQFYFEIGRPPLTRSPPIELSGQVPVLISAIWGQLSCWVAAVMEVVTSVSNGFRIGPFTDSCSAYYPPLAWEELSTVYIISSTAQ